MLFAGNTQGVPVTINDPGCVRKTFPAISTRSFTSSDDGRRGMSTSSRSRARPRPARERSQPVWRTPLVSTTSTADRCTAWWHCEHCRPARRWMTPRAWLRSRLTWTPSSVTERSFCPAGMRPTPYAPQRCPPLRRGWRSLLPVRAALFGRQKAFRRPPGLVADGRDMGSVVFPDALVKVFVTASAEERARRRYKQLIAKGISVTMESLVRDIRERDERDKGRAAAPLKPAPDAVILDTTDLTIEAAIDRVLGLYRGVVGR